MFEYALALVISVLRRAVQGSLTETTSEARPTYFLGVPRVWEKFADRIQGAVRESSALRQTIFSWARRQGLATGLEASRTGYTTDVFLRVLLIDY